MRIAGLLLQWRYLAFLNPYDATIALDLLRRWEGCGAAGRAGLAMSTAS